MVRYPLPPLQEHLELRLHNLERLRFWVLFEFLAYSSQVYHIFHLKHGGSTRGRPIKSFRCALTYHLYDFIFFFVLQLFEPRGPLFRRLGIVVDVFDCDLVLNCGSCFNLLQEIASFSDVLHVYVLLSDLGWLLLQIRVVTSTFELIIYQVKLGDSLQSGLNVVLVSAL